MVDHLIADWLLGVLHQNREGLKHAIRNYEPFRANPRGYLARNDLRIGPNPCRGSDGQRARTLYLLAALPGLALYLNYDSIGGDGGTPGLIAFLTFVAYIVVVAGLVLPRLFPRQRMILRSDSVVICDHQYEVVCPWKLFQSNEEVRADED